MRKSLKKSDIRKESLKRTSWAGIFRKIPFSFKGVPLVLKRGETKCFTIKLNKIVSIDVLESLSNF